MFRKMKEGVESKGDDLLDTFHISKQSAYLFGRERKVADIPVDHPSLSKQHAVLQYRALPTRSELGGPTKLRCKPFLIDLESTNGTFINGVRLESARYVHHVRIHLKPVAPCVRSLFSSVRSHVTSQVLRTQTRGCHHAGGFVARVRAVNRAIEVTRLKPDGRYE